MKSLKVNFYIALDVHKDPTVFVVRDWKGNIVAEGSCSTDYKDVKSNLEPYLFSCVVGMEASTGFYPLHRGFLQDNIPVKVANVIHIRNLIDKTDLLDARRLSDMLRLGTFPESYIPNEEIQKLRSLVALRHSFLQQQTATKNRIHAVLAMAGIKIPERSTFTQKWCKHLEKVIKDNLCGSELNYLYEHYKSVTENLEKSTAELIEYAKEIHPKEFELLMTIDGIGPLVSSYTIADVCPISRFKSNKKLRRYAGVVPGIKESAKKRRKSILPKFSSRHLLRWAFVQAAHAAKRKKTSRLRKYYNIKLKKNKDKQKSVMAVASSICDIVFNTLTKETPYN